MPDMRFAPPPAMRLADHAGGHNQTSVRTMNERLVMSLLRQHTSLSRMELGQYSGLSAQTVSVIVRALQRDKLILAGEAKRGRVGPPSTPMALDPDGAFAIGVKVGAKSTDVVLIDFTGRIRRHLHLQYTHPAQDEIIAHLSQSFTAMTQCLRPAWRDRIVGVGVSLSAEIEEWPRAEWNTRSTDWQNVDFEVAISKFSDFPVYIQNDVTAAAGAEMIFGAARQWGDFAYIFVGSSSDSRLVLNYHIYAGQRGKSLGQRTDNSSALVFGTEIVSLTDLERALKSQGIDPTPLWHTPDNWPGFGDVLDDWIVQCAVSLVAAMGFIRAFVDIDSLLIGGRFPDTVRERICAEVIVQLNGSDIKLAKVLAGEVGTFAKAVGAASLPFLSRFMVEDVSLAAVNSSN